MTGPQHYRLAEKALEASADIGLHEDSLIFLAEAQVHATLALAAATAQDRLGLDDRRSWDEAISA